LRLLSTTAALASALFLAPGAVGNECGAVVAGEVTCTSGGNYGSGISYDGSDVSGDLTMTVQGGTEIDASGDDVEGILIDVSPTPAPCALPPSPALSTGTTSPTSSFIPPIRLW
jgi:hypothetical protein